MPLKIHLHQIPLTGGKWEGEEDPHIFGLSEVGALPIGPLSYCLEGGISNDGFFAVGSLSLKVQLQCVACLCFFEYKIQVDHVAIQTELEGREIVDLTPLVREDILLALPLYPRCDSTSELSCPATFPTEAKAVESERDTSQTAWEALKNLNLKKNS